MMQWLPPANIPPGMPRAGVARLPWFGVCRHASDDGEADGIMGILTVYQCLDHGDAVGSAIVVVGSLDQIDRLETDFMVACEHARTLMRTHSRICPVCAEPIFGEQSARGICRTCVPSVQ